MSIGELLEQFRERSSDAYELARRLSLAVVVEPELLRRFRLNFIGDAPAAVEAELWFSEIVESRSSSGLVFDNEAGLLLRERLARTPEDVEASWNILEPLHHEITPAIRLEEELRYWSHRDGVDSPSAQSKAKIEQLLHSASLALAGAERGGLASWALRALARLPLSVRQSEAGRMLATAAALRVSDSIDPDSLEGNPEWLPWVIPNDQPHLTVGLDFDGRTLRFGDPAEPDVLLLNLPRTDPLQLQLSWKERDGEGRRTVVFRAGEEVTEEVPEPEVRLQTLTGEVYDLHANMAGAVGESRRIQTFEAERERHRPYFGFEKLVERIGGELRENSYFVVTGTPAAGKTALLCRVLDEAETTQDDGNVGIVPHHFIGAEIEGRPSLAGAIENLALQLENRFPLFASPGQQPRLRLRNLLSEISRRVLVPESKRLLLILGGVQHAEDVAQAPNPLADYLPGKLPEGVCLVWETNSVRLRSSLQELEGWAVVDLGLENLAPDREQAFKAALADYPVSEIENAAKSSGGDLYYSRLVSEWPDVVSPLPATLDDFLDHVVQKQLLDDVGAEPPLAMICCMEEPAPREFLDELVRGLDLPLIGKLLLNWKLSPLVMPVHEGSTFLRLHHPRLRQSLLRLLPRDIARAARNGYFSFLTQWPPAPGLGEFASGYIARHALRRFLSTEDKEGLDRLIDSLEFLAATLAELGPLEFGKLIQQAVQLLGVERVGHLQRAVDSFLSQERPDPKDLPSMVSNSLRLESAAGLGVRPVAPPTTGPSLFLTGVALTSSTTDRSEAGHKGAVGGCRFIDEGKRLLSWSEDATLRVWDVETGRLEGVLRGHTGAVTACVVNGNSLLSASLDGTVLIWNLADRAFFQTLTGHRAGVVDLRVEAPSKWESGSPPERCLTASSDGTARLWDIRQGREALILEGHEGEVVTAVVSPDGERIYSAGRDGSIRVWEVSSGESVMKVDVHKGPVRGLEFLPGNLLSWSEDRTLVLSDPTRWLKRHELAVSRVLVFQENPGSPDTLIVSGGEDRRVIVWEPENEEPVEEFQDHAGAILSLAVEPGSGWLVAGSADRMISVRNGIRRDQEKVRLLSGHRAPVRALALHGNLLISGSDDGKLLRWDLTAEQPQPHELGTWARSVVSLSFRQHKMEEDGYAEPHQSAPS